MLGRAILAGLFLGGAAASGQDVSLYDDSLIQPIATLEGHTDQVRDVEFFGDDKFLASCSHDGTVRLWNADSGQQVSSIHVQERSLYDLAVSPDGKILATAGLSGKVTLIDLQERSTISAFTPDEWRVSTISWTPDGETVIVQNARGLVLIRASDGESESISLVDEIFSAGSMAVSADGERVAVGGHGARLRIWERSARRNVAEFVALPQDVPNLNNLSAVMSLAFSPNEDTLAVSSGFKISSTISLWDTDTGSLTRKFDGHHGTVWCIRFSPDGRLLAGAGDDLVIWDAASGDVLAKWRPDQDQRDILPPSFHAYGLDFSSNGDLLASAGSDKTVKLFRIRSAPDDNDCRRRL